MLRLAFAKDVAAGPAYIVQMVVSARFEACTSALGWLSLSSEGGDNQRVLSSNNFLIK